MRSVRYFTFYGHCLVCVSPCSRKLCTMLASRISSNQIEERFDELLKDKTSTMLLDGGTGEELFRRGVPDDRKIWSATAVVHQQYHEALRKVHESFVDSGSEAITSNSYGIVPGVGFSESDIKKYVADAGRLARESLSLRKQNTFVLGSLGPLQESYRPDLILRHQDGVRIYRIMIEALAPYVDCYLAETMSSYDESIQAIEAVGSNNKPILVSFALNCKGLLRSGEPPTDVIIRLRDFAKERNVKLFGVLFNCSEPEAITIALKCIREEPCLNGLILGAYANRLTTIPDNWELAESECAQAMRSDLTPEQYWHTFVSEWITRYNVQLIGGCCGITPEHIRYLRDQISRKNNNFRLFHAAR